MPRLTLSMVGLSQSTFSFPNQSPLPRLDEELQLTSRMREFGLARNISSMHHLDSDPAS